MVSIFTPVESMNPLYLQGDDIFSEIIELHKTTMAEIKEDGYRAQIHKKGKNVNLFTRAHNSIVFELFPELHDTLMSIPDCILDTELIGSGKIGKDGFDSVKRRFRPKISDKGKQEYLQSGIVSEYPLELRVFDVLFWKEKDITGLPLSERRKITQDISVGRISPSLQRIISDPAELRSHFEELTGSNYEGLVCKNPASAYQPGARNKDWIKIKREETFDLAVLGAYYSKGRLAQLLCGTWNPESGKYETLAKVNAQRQGLDRQVEPLLAKLKRKPASFVLADGCEPEVYVSPKKSPIVEVAAMNIQFGETSHTCGFDGKNAYSLRIGWLKSIRDDKNTPMTSKDVAKMYVKVEQ